MYIRKIILSLLITCCKSDIFGLRKPDTLLRHLVPIMMDANRQFNDFINQALMNKCVQIPLEMPDDPFVATTVYAAKVAMNVTNFTFILMRNCKIVSVEGDLLTQNIKVTVFCSCIGAEGQNKPQKMSNTKNVVGVDLKGVTITINVVLSLNGGKMILNKPFGSVTYTRGILRATSVRGDTNEIALSSQFKKFIEDKISFYFANKMEDMLRLPVASVEVMAYFCGDQHAMALFNTANQGLSKVINNVIDQKIQGFIETKCKNGYCPVKNLDLTFSKRFLLLTYSGKIELMNGYIGNFKTFDKIGNLALFGDTASNRYTALIKIHMEEAFAYFEDMNTNIWGWQFIQLSGIKGTIKTISLEIGIDVSLNIMGFVAKVNEVVLVIPEMGRITTQIRSLGLLLGLIASLMQSLITEIFHFIFIWLFEQTIQDLLNINLVGKEISLLG